MGWFLDSSTNAASRALNGLNVVNNVLSSNSQENCSKYCSLKKFVYSGVVSGSDILNFIFISNNIDFNLLFFPTQETNASVETIQIIVDMVRMGPCAI